MENEVSNPFCISLTAALGSSPIQAPSSSINTGTPRVKAHYRERGSHGPRAITTFPPYRLSRSYPTAAGQPLCSAPPRPRPLSRPGPLFSPIPIVRARRLSSPTIFGPPLRTVSLTLSLIRTISRPCIIVLPVHPALSPFARDSYLSASRRRRALSPLFVSLWVSLHIL